MRITEAYHYINIESNNPRTKDWWLVSSPLQLAMILSSYLYFVLIYGPRYMQNKKPYALNTFLTCYNVFQIISNAWIIRKILTGGWLTHLTIGCEPVDDSLNPMAVQLAEAVWWELMLKLIDLTETAVFVLRKKDKQISFLHLYHHVSTPFVTWLVTKYAPGGMATFPILINNMVHVIMYTYYFLSARGPRIRTLASFVKPYITIIQMVQFGLLAIHAIAAISPSCDIPSLGAYIHISNLMINFFLFLNFYRQSYVASKKTKLIKINNATNGLAEVYRYYNFELADPRTSSWSLISSPFQLAIILLAYFYFIFVYGPRYMQNKEPYSLKTFLTCYNIFQIVFNAWIIRKIATGGWLTHLTLGCELIDYSLDPMAVQLAEAVWWTFILKLIDLSETLVFVLRKKEKQISFLHVYHHVSVLLLAWIGVKYYAGVMITFGIMVNNWVHVIMYTYYFLSTRGPRIRALVSFFKPYVTIIQMVQFYLLFVYASQGISDSCEYSTVGTIIIMADLLINLFLFMDFYRRNYPASKKTV